MSKSAFVQTLQVETKALSPFDISQRVRQQHGCVCIYQGDPDLEIEKYRGYMIRYNEKTNRTPEDPELYVCVVSLRQSKAWQDLVWTKEILQILDGPGHQTRDKAALGHVLDNREALPPHVDGTPLNVRADKNGFTLALGCTVPLGYRRILRTERFAERYDAGQLEKLLLVPAEFIPWLLGPEFETEFGAAVLESDHTAA